MILREISAGKISGTGTLTIGRNMTVGGIVISADGTNNAAVVLRVLNVTGDIKFDMTTKNSLSVFAPIYIGNSTVYYSITGTGATAELYEWIFSEK